MTDREKVISTLEDIKTQTAEIGLDSAVIAHKFIDKILALLKEQGNEYEKGFNDAMQGKRELMYEGIDGKWHKKNW